MRDDVFEGMGDGVVIEGMGDDVAIGNAKEVGIVKDENNVSEEETTGKGKQHSEELEQTGPIDVHEYLTVNTERPPSFSNLI